MSGTTNLDGAVGSPVTIGATIHSDIFFDGLIDEVAVFDTHLSDSIINNIYSRGMAALRFQVRSCDDPACSGEAFIGPDGTRSSYYSELDNSAIGLPNLSLTNLSSNRYFQYETSFDTSDASIQPYLYDVSITTDGSSYSTDSPSIRPSSSFNQQDLYELTGFEETAVKDANAEIYYHLSDDNASTWKWWNGSSWADIQEGVLSDADTLALWHLNGLTGDVVDSSSYSNNGANQGASRGVAGKYGNAFDFDGATHYIDIPYNASLNLVNTDFTIEFWINTDDADGVVIKKYTGSVGGDSWGVRLSSGVVEFYDGSSWISTGITANTGSWKHIAITGNDSTNTLEFFEDGKSKGTHSFHDITANTQNVFIASDLDSDYLDASLDEIRISGRVRSDEEILKSVWLFNTADEVDSNINAYSVTTEDIMFKAFLKSDGDAQADLDNLRLSCTYSINNSPSATVPGNISQAVDGSGLVTFETTVSDSDNDDTRLKVEYSDDGGVHWYDAVIDSVTPDSGTVSLNNAVEYQIGSTDAIDSSGGDVGLTIVWDTQSASNGNGSLDDQDLTDVQVRVIPNDNISDGAAGVSASFEVDNLDPAGLANFTALSAGTSWLSWSFDSVTTENNFNHYEVWYGTDQAVVESRGGGASEWDNSDDANLANMTASSTTISGLSSGTTYYAKIWAVDDFGNESTTTIASNKTSSSSSSSSGGGGGGGGGGASSASTSSSSTSSKSSSTQEEVQVCLEYDSGRSRTFLDLSSDHWAYKYIEFLKKIKLIETDEYILNGYSINASATTAEVGPDNNIKRYELIKMVLNANCIPVREDISSENGQVFSDISRDLTDDEGTNFAKKVMYTALDEGIISGYSEDFSARPWNDVNRAEAMKIILKAAGIDVEGAATDAFNDVGEQDWFREYVAYAYKKGIVKGYSDDPGYFHPERTMTRAEASKVIALAMPLSNKVHTELKQTIFDLFADDIPYDTGEVLGLKAVAEKEAPNVLLVISLMIFGIYIVTVFSYMISKFIWRK
jgi:hypothetical protein